MDRGSETQLLVTKNLNLAPGLKGHNIIYILVLPLQCWIMFVKTMEKKFEFIINDLVSSSRFIWIPILWVYGHSNFFKSFSVGIVFIGHTSESDVYWRKLLTNKDCPRFDISWRLYNEWLLIKFILSLVVLIFSWHFECHWSLIFIATNHHIRYENVAFEEYFALTNWLITNTYSMGVSQSDLSKHIS